MTTGAARTPSRYRVTVTLRRPRTVCGVAVWLAGNRQDQLPRSS
jgi:hypothetical protein